VELARRTESAGPLAVLLLDLEDFRLFNHTYGYPAGDELLRRVALALHKVCRTGDSLARFAGDQFMLVLPDTTLREAVRRAERDWRAVFLHSLPVRGLRGAAHRFSCGIAAFPGDAVTT
jgi:diguanylate cyclase (GGDEF)-like protein